jgi:hypothetical protein
MWLDCPVEETDKRGRSRRGLHLKAHGRGPRSGDVTRLARVEREVVDLRRVPERRSLNRGDQPFGLPQPNSVAPVLTTLLNSSRAPG